jgi:nitric oxide reductase NorE protein
VRDGTETPRALAVKPAGHWPGEPALWSLLCADLTLFGFMFIVYAHDRYQNLALFSAARPAMNESMGLAQTLLLLASSWFVAAATQAAKRNVTRATLGYAIPGIACGVAFCALKVIDYAGKFALGITPNTSLFFTYFFAFTGIHLVHVIIAIIVMGLATWRYRKAEKAPKDFIFLESAASFWHLVDILWIMLFALLYLIR